MEKPPTDHVLKEVLKEAVVEALHEQREWLQQVVADVLEEMALTEALREIEGEAIKAKKSGFGMVEGEA
jgi:hypothetical protein